MSLILTFVEVVQLISPKSEHFCFQFCTKRGEVRLEYQFGSWGLILEAIIQVASKSRKTIWNLEFGLNEAHIVQNIQDSTNNRSYNWDLLVVSTKVKPIHLVWIMKRNESESDE